MAGRTVRLPFDHLVAEIAAYPIAAEAALTLPLTHLDPEMKGATGALWRSAEHELLGAAPGISLDELIALRDGSWFDGDLAGPRPLAEHLHRTSRRHLQNSGGGVSVRLPTEMRGGPVTTGPAYAESRRAWMWLTFALPADLLLAVFGDHPVAEPDLLSEPVRDLLTRGFAETHLHVGASLGFPEVWALTVNRMAHPDLAGRSLEAPGAVLGEGSGLRRWLAHAAVARFLLGWYLVAGHRGPFESFLHDPGIRRIALRRTGAADWSLLLTSLGHLATGAVPDGPSTALRGAYGSLARAPRPEQVTDVDALPAMDPLHLLLGGAGCGNAEQLYVSAMCRRVKAGGDPLAAALFWQTVRVRTVLYRYLTQRPLRPGLPWFIRFYQRMSAARGSLPNPLMVAAASRTSGNRDGLRSLEVRTSPETSMRELRSWVETVAAGANPVERGLVFHFLKDRAGNHAVGLPRVRGAGTNADPRTNAKGYRYGRYFAGQTRAAIALAAFLQRWPRTQTVVRGLDICSDELAVPTWVLRPLLQHVRAAARNGARHLRRIEDRPLSPLRTTVHAGEDFAHLLTGLRHIHEAIDMLQLREGDRIGHGMALGTDPALWAARVGRVAMPIEDRVLDLSWEWTWWTRRGSGADAARLAYLAREIEELGSLWFDRPVSPLQIETLRADLGNTEHLEAVGFPRGGAHARGPRLGLLGHFLTDGAAFVRGREIRWIDPAGEVDALTRIAGSLREEVARSGLAIEVNPTSNLLVGDLGDLSAHPLWRLAPPRPRPDLPPLTVTVGSDDPLVFNCRLPREYQLLFDSLLLAGLTDTEALHWLDRVRRNGMERRFTVPHREKLFAAENPGAPLLFPL